MSEQSQELVETVPATRQALSSVHFERRGEGGGLVLIPTNLDQAVMIAQMLSRADVGVPAYLRGNPGACLLIVIQATDWEMNAFSVAKKTYKVNDQIAYEAQLINSVVNTRAPIKGRPRIIYEGEGGELRATVEYTMKDGEVLEYRSPKVKDIPVKNSPLWKADPEQQLFYYSTRAWARRWVPEVLMGVYTPDEMLEVTAEEKVRATSFAALEERAASIDIQEAEIEEIKPKTSVIITHTLSKGHAKSGERYLKLADPISQEGFVATYIDGAGVDNIAYAEAGELQLYDKHPAKPKAKEPATDAVTAAQNRNAAHNANAQNVMLPQSAPAVESPVVPAEPASPASDAGTGTGAGTSGSGEPITAPAAVAGEEAVDLQSTAVEQQEIVVEQDEGPASNAIPEEFTRFAEIVAGATEWTPIREALPPLKKSAAWKAAEPEMHIRLHHLAFTRLMELVHEGYRFDFTEDLHAYRCYVDFEQDADTLKLHRNMVHKTKVWMDLQTDAKVVFDKAYAAAETRLAGAAAYG